jgi:hypothetical protein
LAPNPQGTEAAPEVGKLIGHAKHTVEQQCCARIRRQRRFATLKNHFAGGGGAFDRDMQHVAEQAVRPVADLGRTHEWRAIEITADATYSVRRQRSTTRFRG